MRRCPNGSEEIINKLTRTLLIVAGIGLLLNLAWENFQAPLYQGYSNFWQHFPICSVASLGDALIVLVLYLVLAAINRNMFWIAKLNRANIMVLIILGTLVGIGIEKWALATERWQYNSAMPLIPYIGVGLLPVLQMSLLPLLTYYIGKRVAPVQ